MARFTDWLNIDPIFIKNIIFLSRFIFARIAEENIGIYALRSTFTT